MGFVYAYTRPMRWPILNWSRCATLLLQAIQLLICFFEVRGTAEQVVTWLIMVMCLVEALLGAACAIRGWIIYDALHYTMDTASIEDGYTPLNGADSVKIMEKEMVTMVRPPPKFEALKFWARDGWNERPPTTI